MNTTNVKCRQEKTAYTNPWEKQEVAFQLWDLTEFSENELASSATCMCVGSHFHIVKTHSRLVNANSNDKPGRYKCLKSCVSFRRKEIPQKQIALGWLINKTASYIHDWTPTKKNLQWMFLTNERTYSHWTVILFRHKIKTWNKKQQKYFGRKITIKTVNKIYWKDTYRIKQIKLNSYTTFN